MCDMSIQTETYAHKNDSGQYWQPLTLIPASLSNHMSKKNAGWGYRSIPKIPEDHPLPESVFTFHQSVSVVLPWEHFHSQHPSDYLCDKFEKCTFEITTTCLTPISIQAPSQTFCQRHYRITNSVTWPLTNHCATNIIKNIIPHLTLFSAALT